MAKEQNEKPAQDKPAEAPKAKAEPEPKLGEFTENGKVFVRERLSTGAYIVHRLS